MERALRKRVSSLVHMSRDDSGRRGAKCWVEERQRLAEMVRRHQRNRAPSEPAGKAPCILYFMNLLTCVRIT